MNNDHEFCFIPTRPNAPEKSTNAAWCNALLRSRADLLDTLSTGCSQVCTSEKRPKKESHKVSDTLPYLDSSFRCLVWFSVLSKLRMHSLDLFSTLATFRLKLWRYWWQLRCSFSWHGRHFIISEASAIASDRNLHHWHGTFLGYLWV